MICLNLTFPPVFIKFIETQPHLFYILYVLLLCFRGTYIVVTETMWLTQTKIFFTDFYRNSLLIPNIGDSSSLHRIRKHWLLVVFMNLLGQPFIREGLNGGMARWKIFIGQSMGKGDGASMPSWGAAFCLVSPCVHQPGSSRDRCLSHLVKMLSTRFLCCKGIFPTSK